MAWLMVICLKRGADWHMAQLMPLPHTVSCFSKIQISFTFLVPAHLGSPRKRAVKRVCVRVHLFFCVYLTCFTTATSGRVGTLNENQVRHQRLAVLQARRLSCCITHKALKEIKAPSGSSFLDTARKELGHQNLYTLSL